MYIPFWNIYSSVTQISNFTLVDRHHHCLSYSKVIGIEPIMIWMGRSLEAIPIVLGSFTFEPSIWDFFSFSIFPYPPLPWSLWSWRNLDVGHVFIIWYLKFDGKAVKGEYHATTTCSSCNCSKFVEVNSHLWNHCKTYLQYKNWCIRNIVGDEKKNGSHRACQKLCWQK